MSRYYYYREIAEFITDSDSFILGELAKYHEFSLEEQQRNAWSIEIKQLKRWLPGLNGYLIFEYSIPRMGKRVDCVIISGAAIFIIEFKIGSLTYEGHAFDQVTDYALDLKNFHEQSHARKIIPILICTEAREEFISEEFDPDGVARPILSNGNSLRHVIESISNDIAEPPINATEWANSKYCPTPTIVEAAQALYKGHSVQEISRSDAGAINLSNTANAIFDIIADSKRNHKKSICFITGVPGAGKTLAGLNIANSWHNESNSEHAVFLSGNGPLVEVLREALARNELANAKENGRKQKKSVTISKAKAFIQNIHHFRDDALESQLPPIEQVVVFDEAQRAWTLKQTASFMKKKKGKSDFNQSEPEFLIGVMDRHCEWAVIICLIGGGQEINTGEAGLHEWFDSLKYSFPYWSIYISSKLSDYEYTQGRELFGDEELTRITINDNLHLSVSIRSFRSENVAAFVKATLDCDIEQARSLYNTIKNSYPILITRELKLAKEWLSNKARGTERYGLIASSGALRLRPFGINVKTPIEPKNWFLNGKTDIRSSYYLEDVATEFDIQGLELDWACVAWDADLRYNGKEWTSKSFRGTSWHDVNDPDSKLFLKNAYRVLLTRARQGMIIFVPYGSNNDHTRLPAFYDKTYEYLCSLGIEEIGK
jgi:hypothetical protein